MDDGVGPAPFPGGVRAGDRSRGGVLRSSVGAHCSVRLDRQRGGDCLLSISHAPLSGASRARSDVGGGHGHWHGTFPLGPLVGARSVFAGRYHGVCDPIHRALGSPHGAVSPVLLVCSGFGWVCSWACRGGMAVRISSGADRVGGGGDCSISERKPITAGGPPLRSPANGESLAPSGASGVGSRAFLVSGFGPSWEKT